MSVQHPLDEAIRLESLGDGRYQGAPPKQYWNMVGPFGGISAAIVLQSVLCEDNVTGDPLAMTVNYAAPIQDAPFELTVRSVRASRTTQHWTVEVDQLSSKSNRVERVLQAMVTTGLRRDLWSKQTEVRPVPAVGAEDSPRRKPPIGLPWFDRYDQRLTADPMTAGVGSDPLLVWVRDEPPRPLDYPSLAAICDTFFPNIFALRQKFVPIATVTMNTYFHVNADEMAGIGSSHLLTSSIGNTYQHGFCDAQGMVWSDDRLVATSQQVMWYAE